MACSLLIFSQSDYLLQVVESNSYTYWQTVQIQIRPEAKWFGFALFAKTENIWVQQDRGYKCIWFWWLEQKQLVCTLSSESVDGLSALFYHTSLDWSISNSRVSGYFLLSLCFVEIPVVNANSADTDQMWHLISIYRLYTACQLPF